METFQTISEKDLLEAYNNLFVNKKVSSIEHLRFLDAGTVKDAYRERAFAAHPDRAEVLGIEVNKLEEEFKEITVSFEKLYYFVKNKNQVQIETSRIIKQRTEPLYERSELLFGQYLYYKGIITFKTLLDAVYWQRNQRPPFGRLANEWNLFSEEDTQRILKNRRPRERFGDCALRLGLVSSFQHKAILLHQKKIQKPIGNFFVQEHILRPDELEVFLERHRLYNERIKGSRFN